MIGYLYRMAQGGSVPASTPWERAADDYTSADELSIKLARLVPNTRYAFEVATESSAGRSPAVRTAVTTGRFTGPHYTLSVPGSARENANLTITVRRTNTVDGETTALVEIHDSHGPHRIRHYDAVFGANSTSVTVAATIPDDEGDNARTLEVRIATVGRSDKNTYSAAPTP